MVLTKDELIGALQNEVRILLHLISKVDLDKLDYRPTANQRSTLKLVQYLAIMAPIHLRTILAPGFDMNAWRRGWSTSEASAKSMSLEDAKMAIGEQSDLFRERLSACSDADFGAELEMFGARSSRGSWIVSLMLCHYAAYRMQLFHYLKSSGRDELNTLNLWAGMDGPV